MKPYAAPGGLAHAKIDLTVSVDSASVLVRYMTEVYDEYKISGILSGYLRALSAAMEDMHQEACALPLFGMAEEHGESVVQKLSMGKVDLTHLEQQLVHQSMQNNALKDPERPCLFFKDASLSYGEVGRRADALASHLASVGVVCGTAVGIMLNRSFELVISILATWKVCEEITVALC